MSGFACGESKTSVSPLTLGTINKPCVVRALTMAEAIASAKSAGLSAAVKGTSTWEALTPVSVLLTRVSAGTPERSTLVAPCSVNRRMSIGTPNRSVSDTVPAPAMIVGSAKLTVLAILERKSSSESVSRKAISTLVGLVSSPSSSIETPVVPAVIPREPVSAIKPLPSLVVSALVSRSAANVPSVLITSTTVAAVVAVGSTSIVSVPATSSNVTNASLPVAVSLTKTTSTFSKVAFAVTALIRMSLLSPAGARAVRMLDIVWPCSSVMRPSVPSGE